MDDQVLKADEPDRRHPFVRAIEQMLDPRGKVLREHLLDPLALHRAGQAEQREVCRGARGDFANRRGDEQRGVLHHALAHQRAVTALGQLAFQRPLVSPNAELIDETGHDAARQGVIRGRIGSLPPLPPCLLRRGLVRRARFTPLIEPLPLGSSAAVCAER